MSPANHVLYAKSLDALEAALLAEVDVVKAADSLALVLVVTGSNLQHIYLRRLLARSRGSTANVRFITLIDLAGEVFFHTPAAAGLTSMPEGSAALISTRLLTTAGGSDGVNWQAPGMAEALASTIDDLREAMLEPADIRGAISPDPLATELAALYERFEEMTGPFLDRTRLLTEAAGAVVPQVHAALPDCPLLVYGIYDLTDVQFRLLSAVSRARPMTLFVPWDDTAEALRFASRTVERFQGAGFQVHAIGGTVMRPNLEVFSTTDRQAEAEEVVRLVLRDIEQGTPPSEIAVLHHLDLAEEELLETVFHRANLPCYLAGGRAVRRTAIGKAALALNSLMFGSPSRSMLLELMSLPVISLDWVADGLQPAPLRWEALSKELGLVGNWDHFIELLTLATLSGESDDSSRDDYRREQAAGLLRVIEALYDQSRALRSHRSWRAVVESWLRLFARLLSPVSQAEAYQTIAGRIEALKPLDGLGIECSPELFRHVADRAVRTAVLRGGYFQRDGVFVGSVYAARTLRFSRVYIVDCAERVFPPLVRQDPLLRDEDRRAINDHVGAPVLPLKAARLDEERLIFELARQSARNQLTISYARRASLTGPPRLPSSLLLEAMADQAGAFHSNDWYEREQPDWFRRVPSRLGYDERPVPGVLRAFDDSDLRMHLLERSGGEAARLLKSLWPGYDRLVQQREARSLRRFTAYDGIVAPELVAASGALDRNFSATGLAAYVTCPYRFFLGQVLGLRPTPEPELTMEISPLDRGAFAHRVLQRFAKQAVDGLVTWEVLLDDAEGPLQVAFDEETASLPAGVSGLPLSWQRERQIIHQAILAYLQTQRLDASQGWAPVGVELWFEDVPIDLEGSTIKVHGVIDRLDRRGDRLRIVDYKTGAVRESSQGYRKGESLQLPLYIIAAAHAEQVDPASVSAEYHYVGRRNLGVVVGLQGAALGADRRLAEVLRTVVEHVTAGNFFYWPGAAERNGANDNCKFCDFTLVCHGQVHADAQRKAGESAAVIKPWASIKRP